VTLTHVAFFLLLTLVTFVLLCCYEW